MMIVTICGISKSIVAKSLIILYRLHSDYHLFQVVSCRYKFCSQRNSEQFPFDISFQVVTFQADCNAAAMVLRL